MKHQIVFIAFNACMLKACCSVTCHLSRRQLSVVNLSINVLFDGGFNACMFKGCCSSLVLLLCLLLMFWSCCLAIGLGDSTFVVDVCLSLSHLVLRWWVWDGWVLVDLLVRVRSWVGESYVLVEKPSWPLGAVNDSPSTLIDKRSGMKISIYTACVVCSCNWSGWRLRLGRVALTDSKTTTTRSLSLGPRTRTDHQINYAKMFGFTISTW